MTSPDFYHVVLLQQLTRYEQMVYWEVQAGCHIQQTIVIQEVKDRFCLSHHTYLSNGSQRSYDSLFSVIGNFLSCMFFETPPSEFALHHELLLTYLLCKYYQLWFFHFFSSDECFTYSFVCIICEFKTLVSTGIINGHL